MSHERLQKNPGKKNTGSVISTLKNRIKSGSMSNLTASNVNYVAPRNSFSAIVSGGTMSRSVTSTVQRKAMASKNRLDNVMEDDFKVRNVTSSLNYKA